MPDDGERGAVFVLGPGEVDALIAALQQNARDTAIALCRWCESLGMVDGDDGPRFYDHPPPIDT